MLGRVPDLEHEPVDGACRLDGGEPLSSEQAAQNAVVTLEQFGKDDRAVGFLYDQRAQLGDDEPLVRGEVFDGSLYDHGLLGEIRFKITVFSRKNEKNAVHFKIMAPGVAGLENI